MAPGPTTRAEPELALGCAAYLSDTVPVASHIQHMPSHTYNEVGMWGDAVRANLKGHPLEASMGCRWRF